MRKFNFKLDNGKRFTIKPPTLRQYYKGLLTAENDPQLFRSVAEICNRNDEGTEVTEEYIVDNFTTDDLHRFMMDFPAWVNGEKESDPN